MRVLVDILVVAAGGAIGASLRYVTSVVTPLLFGGRLVAATAIVNLVGCFLIGILWTVFQAWDVDRRISLLLLVGLLGSLTTFSTFALEGFELMTHGRVAYGLLYVVGSNVVGLALVAAGVLAGRSFVA